jgi:hypothetical protein
MNPNPEYIIIVKENSSYKIYTSFYGFDLTNKDIAICHHSDKFDKPLDYGYMVIKNVKSVKIIGFVDIQSVVDSGVVPEELKNRIEEATPLPIKFALDPLNKLNLTIDQKKIHPTQDFIDGVMYYGISKSNNISFISSNRKLVNSDDLISQGITLTSEDTEIFRFSKLGITPYLQDDYSVDPSILYDKINSYIRRYIFLKDPKEYTFLTLWIMGTYIYRLFRYFPYVHLNAEKGSGKSTLMATLQPIAFNGKIIIETTGPALFREVHNNGSTLFIDEAEIFGGKSNRTSSIRSILNAGFSKMGNVTRANINYFIYSPKMFASINPLDDVLGSRSVTIKLTRPLPNEKVDKYIENTSTLRLQNEIRDGLYIFGLDFAKEIYERYCQDLMSDSLFQHLSGRAYDLWVPIMLIAEVVEYHSIFTKAALKDVLDLSKQSIQAKKEEGHADSDLMNMLTIYDEMQSSLKPQKTENDDYYYLTDDVYDFARGSKLIPPGFTKTKFTKWLCRTLNAKTVNVKHKDKTRRVYKINKREVSDLMLRYGYEAKYMN